MSSRSKGRRQGVPISFSEHPVNLKLLKGYVLGLIGLFSFCLYALVIAALFGDLRSRRSKAGARSDRVRLAPGEPPEVVSGIRLADQVQSSAPDLENKWSDKVSDR